MSKVFAYIRVSTREQNENRQLDALKDLNIDEIVVEKASGKNFVGREKYQQMKAQLREGDLLIIHSIDRFGRNYTEICKEWETLIDKGVDIQVLDMPILNTRDNQRINREIDYRHCIKAIRLCSRERKNQYQNKTG